MNPNRTWANSGTTDGKPGLSLKCRVLMTCWWQISQVLDGGIAPRLCICFTDRSEAPPAHLPQPQYWIILDALPDGLADQYESALSFIYRYRRHIAKHRLCVNELEEDFHFRAGHWFFSQSRLCVWWPSKLTVTLRFSLESVGIWASCWGIPEILASSNLGICGERFKLKIS